MEYNIQYNLEIMLSRSCPILPSPFKLLVKEDSKKVSDKHRHKTSGQFDIVKITTGTK